MKTKNQNAATEPFRCLGHDKGVFYYLSYLSRQVVAWNPAQHTEANLRSIAPDDYWYGHYKPTKTGADYKAAGQDMQYQCYQVGVFDPTRRRGRGAWYDEGRCVLHLGNRVMIDDKEYSPAEVPSTYIYEAGNILQADLKGEPMKTAEANRFYDLLDMLPWQTPMAARLLAGWCVCAHIGGVLTWRPHVWVIGARGSGKTWTMSHIVNPILGRNCLYVQGDSTEAGIRQTLNGDSLPVLFDEAESVDQRAAMKIQHVLSLMRQSSSESGGIIAKGGATGHSVHYAIRSCFALSSINASTVQASDKSRISVLELSPDLKKYPFEKIAAAQAALITPDYQARFYARAIGLAPVIRQNAVVFASVMATAMGEQRAGDQIGALLAGAYSLYSAKAISYEDALAWVRQQDWAEAKTEVQVASDEQALLAFILDHRVRYRRNFQASINDVPIGVLVDVVAGRITKPEYEPDSAARTLSEAGIRADARCIHVSNTSPYLKRVLESTPWAAGHNRVLRRLPGATSSAPMGFAHSRDVSRAVTIPYDSNSEIG